MNESQFDTDRELDKLINALNADCRVSYVLATPGYDFALHPTFGTAVQMLLDYLDTGREIPYGRIQSSQTPGNRHDEQAARDAIESQVLRLQQIPDALFSLVFHYHGATTLDFRFAGYSEDVAMRVIGEDLANVIRDLWCVTLGHDADRDSFELAAGKIRPHVCDC